MKEKTYTLKEIHDKYLPNLPPTSWACPKCGRCYPIYVRECPHCQPKVTPNGKWECER